MICRSLKYLAILISLVGGLAGCTQFLGSSNSSGSTNAQGAATTRHDPLRRDPITQGHPFSLFGTVLAKDFHAAPFAQGDDFWAHVRSDFQLPPSGNNPEVQAQVAWFTHNRDYLNHVITRAAPYMYYILQQTESRNLPGELVLLPIMESDYNPSAVSSAGAVGMWQLMRSTARGYGAKQNFWFDGRRDLYASTNAALDYLTYLQSYFGGNWLLALAGYNCGEGAVQNAIRRSGERGGDSDFWSLPLPQQTRAYVPRLLALAMIIRNPAKYGITLPAINNQPYLAQVDIGEPITLAHAAQLAGISVAL